MTNGMCLRIRGLLPFQGEDYHVLRHPGRCPGLRAALALSGRHSIVPNIFHKIVPNTTPKIIPNIFHKKVPITFHKIIPNTIPNKLRCDYPNIADGRWDIYGVEVSSNKTGYWKTNK